MLAQMIKIGNLVTMRTTCYTFGGDLYRQTSGAGIGLRSSACLAKLTMGFWDRDWAKIQSMWCFKSMLFLRYIDDLRILCFPIKKGWFWGANGWTFDDNLHDMRDDQTRTREEICKSLNCVMNFLRFTTETEMQFCNNMLPTLDVQISVRQDGSMEFRHFTKPTSSNLLIQRHTALSDQTIFSSLRQDLIRRLKNTSIETDKEVKVGVVEDYIKAMVNSGHSYPYIKSVVQQSLTKYIYLIERANKDRSDKMFLPLYRPNNFRRSERIMLKYIQPMVWNQDESLKDPFRNSWKNRIKRRPKTLQKLNQYGRCTGKISKQTTCELNKNYITNPVSDFRPKTTTTLFVPASINSLLLKRVQEANEECKRDISWGVKILERSGTPLINHFMKTFPINNGCPRGKKCRVCDDDALKCSRRGVVYRASCVECEKQAIGQIENDDEFQVIQQMSDHGRLDSEQVTNDTNLGENLGTEMKKFRYVGETSRPLRERICEHVDNLLNWKKESFWLEHWLETHGTDVKTPDFKFEVIACYRDPMRRQLAEALKILHEGDLNRRNEINSNDLCRLVPEISSIETEKLGREVTANRVEFENKFTDFVTVMSGILSYEHNKQTLTSKFNCRSKRKIKESASVMEGLAGKKRRLLGTLETSTPLARRETPQIISSDQDSSPESSLQSLSSLGGDIQVSPVVRRTNISNDMEKNKITPVKIESKSMEERGLEITCRNWDDAAARMGIIKRTRSLPDLIDLKLENVFFNKRKTRMRSHSLSSIDGLSLESCSWSIEKENLKVSSSGEGEEKQVVNGLSLESYSWSTEKENLKVSSSMEEEKQVAVGDMVQKDVPNLMVVLNKTPKRKLKFSPETEVGLDQKLKHLTEDQLASPTLRKRKTWMEVDIVTSQGRTVTPTLKSEAETPPIGSVGGDLRKMVLGKRRGKSYCGAGAVERATTALRAAASASQPVVKVKEMNLKQAGKKKKKGKKGKNVVMDEGQLKVDVMLKSSGSYDQGKKMEDGISTERKSSVSTQAKQLVQRSVEVEEGKYC